MVEQRVNSGTELAHALKKIGLLAADDMAVIVSKLSIDAFRELVIRSAFDTGYLRSNWAATKRKPSNLIRNGRNPDSSYSDATYPNLAIEPYDTITLYNNTEYAANLEYGVPGRRAQPMVEPTYRSITREAEALAKRLSEERG